MRAMFTMTAAALLSAGLASCNQSHQVNTYAPASAPALRTAAAAPPPPAVAAAPISARHRHRHAWRRHESLSYESDTSSDERASYSEDEASYASVPPPPPPPPEPAVWVDGYGRSHYVATGPEDGNPAALTREDVHKRMSPWHAYDSKCAD